MYLLSLSGWVDCGVELYRVNNMQLLSSEKKFFSSSMLRQISMFRLSCLKKQSLLFLPKDVKSTTWSVRLGHLLLSAKKKNEAAFYETLKVVRAEQIVPLSAASFERGSYQRGYEHIIRFLIFMVLFLNSETM